MGEVKLLRSYGSRWGEGKVHLRAGGVGILVPMCHAYAQRVLPIHAEEIEGTTKDVTCKKCRRWIEEGA